MGPQQEEFLSCTSESGTVRSLLGKAVVSKPSQFCTATEGLRASLSITKCANKNKGGSSTVFLFFLSNDCQCHVIYFCLPPILLH